MRYNNKENNKDLFLTLTIMATDRFGNTIGDVNVDYRIEDLSAYSTEIRTKVQKSNSTESVYVYYILGDKMAVVRFSSHSCNGVEFGNYIDGNTYPIDEILYRLGLVKRVFIPNTYLSIYTQQVAKKKIASYEMADITIQEMYAMGEGADLSAYKGKIAKDSNYLILGDTITREVVEVRNSFGQKVTRGRYEYQAI